MIRRKWLSVCVALVLCLLLLPAAALAADGDSTVYVGGVKLTSTGGVPVYATTDESGAVTTTDATTDNYNVRWDGSTLTLRNATIKEAEEYSDKSNEKIAVYRQSGDLNLALVGENTVDAPCNGTAASCGINLGSGSLTISGEDGASLTVYGGPTERGNSCGIYAYGTITINSGTVTVTGESASADSYGICAGGTVTINGGTLNAASGEAGGNSCGIYTSNSVTIEDGTVSATSGEANGDSDGIYTSGSVTINGGTVTATAGDAVGTGWYSCGIRSKGFITINNGTVNAAGGKAAGTDRSYNYGLCAYKDISINDGTVIATGGNAVGSGTKNYSIGILPIENLTISGGDVTGIGGTGEMSCGIACNYTLTITDGTVVGKGGGSLAGTNIQYSAGINGMCKVEISGGTVTGTGGDTEAGDSFGICTGDTTTVDPVQLTIQNATVTATGGTATNGKSSGISATNTRADVEVTIENAAVTTTGGAAEQGSYGILAETTGTDKSADVTINGNSVVRANMTGEEGVDGEPISGDSIDKQNGIVFENGVGTVYGNVTLRKDLTVGADESLTIPQGAALTIPSGVTVNNSGTITNKGTITNNGILTIVQGGTLTGEVTGNQVIGSVTVLTDGNGSASASPATAEAGTTVTLTADPDSGYRLARWEVVEGDVTITGNRFIMPAENVTVRALFSRIVNLPDTHSIDLIVSDGGEAKLSLTNASAGSTITVTATPDEGYELAYITVDGERISGTTFTMPDSDVTVRVYFREAGSAFTDVPANAYYAGAVSWAVANGITDGTGAGTFSPDAQCTRAEVVTFLWRAMGSPEPSGDNSFTDVPADSYYSKAVQWAMEEGITSGTGADTFSPDAVCTRAEVVTFLMRALDGQGAGSAGFSDVPADSYYSEAVAWAVANGITDGTSATTFSPDAQCTRAQIVTFLYRAVA